MSRLVKQAETAEISSFETHWQAALNGGTKVEDLVESLRVLGKRDEELALLLAETAAEKFDSEDIGKAFEFTSRAALLFDRSETLASVLVESLRDKYLVYEPLEAFISASGIQGGKKSLRESWTRLKDLLKYKKGSFILHREFGPGEIIRVSRSLFTVDFQRSRDHDMSLAALMDSTTPIDPSSLFVVRWKRPEEFTRLLEQGGEQLLERAFSDMSSDGALTEVNLFRLLEGSDVMPKQMWKALKKAAEESPGFILMGDSIIPADNTSLATQVSAVLDTGKIPLSEKTRTVTSLIKAAPAGKLSDLEVLFPDVVEMVDIEKGAVFELAWLCSGKGEIKGFQESTEHLVETKAVRVERAMGEIHSLTCRKVYLERFFRTAPGGSEIFTLLDRLPRNLRELAADFAAKYNPELHAEYLLRALDSPGETAHFMWALERAANLGEYMEPGRIVTLALKNLSFAKSEMQRRICNLLMDKLRPQLEQHISLLDTRRLEALTDLLEESIGAQESGLVLLARRELSGRRTGGFTNIRKFWEDEVIYSSRAGIARRMKELENLQGEKIPAVARQIAEAASHGDLSENAEYTAALEKRDFLLETLNRFRKELKLLRPYPVGQVTAEMVCPPTEVLLESMDSSTDLKTVKVVGPLDSDSSEGCINYKAPLGAALLGLSTGDTVQLPGEREDKWRVTSIKILEEFL